MEPGSFKNIKNVHRHEVLSLDCFLNENWNSFTILITIKLNNETHLQYLQ